MALAPLYFIPAAALLPDRLWIAALLPVPALGLTALAGLRPAGRRVAALVLAMALMAAGCVVLFLFIKPLGMLLYIPCAVTMLTFMPALARPAHQEWTIKQMMFGGVLHIIAQFLKKVELLQIAAAPLSWIFVAYLIAFLFSYNRSMLDDTGPSTVKTLLTQNRKLLAVFCGLSLLVANIRAVGSAIRAAITWVITAVVNAILWLFSFMQPEEEAVESAGTGDIGSLLGVEEAAEQSLFSRIMEIVLITVAMLAAAVLLFFFFKYIGKLLRKLMAVIKERLVLFRQRIAADYDDQSESLMDWGEMRKTAAARFARARQRLLPTRWEKLSPAQTVRRVYKLLLRRTEDPDPSRTAREMIASGALRLPGDAAAPAASLYDRARYSTHPISQAEADELRRKTGV